MAQVRQLTCAALVSAVAPSALECGDYLGFQVLLDNQGFSVGQIDGKPGANFSHALAALQPARKLPASGEPDRATWHALGGDTAGPTTVTYTVTEDDVKGPFVRTIPRSPAVKPFDVEAPRPAPDPTAADITVQVTRDESAVRVTRADGTLIFFAPVTTGSEHDPLPPGDWQVTSVDWHPTFHYNPDLFWDAKAGDTFR